jgi:DNA oxidative demethylase
MPSERRRVRRTSRTPKGLIYRPEFISEEEEKRLLAAIQQLPFESALYHGYVAKRRIVPFGVDYSFETRQVTPGAPLPTFLMSLRDRVAELVSGIAPEQLVEGLVTEYSPGATIGWHRDAPQFGVVFGVSLAAGCRMRLRLTHKEEYEITSLQLEPRSAYAFQDDVRWRWQHSIPAVEQLRYSITFRTLRSNIQLSSKGLVA